MHNNPFKQCQLDLYLNPSDNLKMPVPTIVNTMQQIETLERKSETCKKDGDLIAAARLLERAAKLSHKALGESELTASLYTRAAAFVFFTDAPNDQSDQKNEHTPSNTTLKNTHRLLTQAHRLYQSLGDSGIENEEGYADFEELAKQSGYLIMQTTQTAVEITQPQHLKN